jgi:RhoGEF domain
MGNQASTGERAPLLGGEEEERGRRGGTSSKQRAIEGEIVSTERTYVSSLALCVELYMEPLRALLRPAQLDAIFSVLERILELHRNFLAELEVCLNLPDGQQPEHAQARTQQQKKQKQRKKKQKQISSVGAVFLAQADALKSYSEYVNNYDESMRMLVKCRRKYGKAFERVQEQAQADTRATRLDLLSLLIMPVQRLPRYVLLLRELLHELSSARTRERRALADALAQLQAVCDYVNEEKRRFEQLQEMVRLDGSLRGWQNGAGASLVRRGRFLVAEYPLIAAEPSLPRSHTSSSASLSYLSRSSKTSKLASTSVPSSSPLSTTTSSSSSSRAPGSPGSASVDTDLANSSVGKRKSALTLWLFNDALLITKQLSAVRNFLGSGGQQHQLVMFSFLCTAELLGSTRVSTSALASQSKHQNKNHRQSGNRNRTQGAPDCSRLIRTSAAMLSSSMRGCWPTRQQYFEVCVCFEEPSVVRKFRLQFERLYGEQRRVTLSPGSARLVERLRAQVEELEELEVCTDLADLEMVDESAKSSRPSSKRSGGRKGSQVVGGKSGGGSGGSGIKALSRLRKGKEGTCASASSSKKSKEKKKHKKSKVTSKLRSPFKRKKKKKKKKGCCGCFGI